MIENDRQKDGGFPVQPQSLYYSSEEMESYDPDEYFQSYPIKEIGNYMVSSFYSEKILSGLEILINLGAVEVARNRKKVQELMDHKQLSEEQQKAIEQKRRKQFLEKQLEILNSQNRIVTHGAEDQPNEEEASLILKKEEHKAMVEKYRKESEQREKRHQQILDEMKRKAKEKQEKQLQTIQEKKTIELQLRREQIESNLQQNKKRKQELQQLELQSKEKIKSITQNKSGYDRFEERYQRDIFLPYLQEKQKKLKEIHQFKALNFEEIKQHEKSYLEKKQLQESRRTIFKEDWNYVPPPKSERLNVILQQEKLEKIKKEEEKKLQVELNLVRHAEYAAYLRRNFTPKVDPAKREEIYSRFKMERPLRPESLDLRSIGLSYLQEAKKRKQKIIKIEERIDTEGDPNNNVSSPYTTPKSIEEDSKTQIKSNRDDTRSLIRKRENLRKLAENKEIDDPQKIKQLTIQAQKINQRMKQKQLQLKYKKNVKRQEEVLSLLLSSIEAKIGIIQTYS